MPNTHFIFNLSLSVLNHLGRNLYRSFVTVLGEAISNSWDADAQNVWIYVDRKNNNLVVKDDGIGMDKEDFQNKFLTIGYSKRKGNKNKSPGGRPYIGRKGIGKLALLSCANKISVISKVNEMKDYTGGAIDNSGLDKAIKDNLNVNEYSLDNFNIKLFEKYIKEHKKGTIIIFENIHGGIKNREEYLKQIIALYFRFSLIDKDFNVFFNDEKITVKDLSKLSYKTQFLWTINSFKDEYLNELINLKENKNLNINKNVKGFIASVEKPSDLKIFSVDEKVSIDLFVNGRLREKDFTTAHMPSDLLSPSYLYGQIHYDDLDDDKDRFTSNREGINIDDEKFNEFLNDFKEYIFNKITNEWDKLRISKKEKGDNENTKNMNAKQRSANDLFNATSNDFFKEIDNNLSNYNKKVNSWIDGLREDAKFNFASYAECFISENLIRKYLIDSGYNVPEDINCKILEYIKKEKENKNLGSINIPIRKEDCNLSYLAMEDLANISDKEDHSSKPKDREASLIVSAKAYKPIRDALMHTSRLTDEAKTKLTSIYDEIKARIIDLLFKNKK